MALASLGGCRSGGEAEGDLRIMVPNAPGSGYDITARTVANALDISGILAGVEVFNLPGGQGIAGLQRMAYERGNPSLMMLMGLGLIGAQLTAAAATSVEVTPLARLIEEPEIVVVTPDSPWNTIDELVAAWARDPRAIVVGGGSSPGGPDHLAPMLMAKAAGIPPSQVRYARHDGGGALLAAILARQVGFAVSSIGEYASQIRLGQLRVLAVTSGARARGLDAPTMREAGLDVVFANWRGLVAPPGLAGEDEERLARIVAELERCQPWREAIEAYDWTGAYLPGAQFGIFLGQERQRVGQILNELGLLPARAGGA
jgi:putative tricarboxylic transport membrane protein